MGSQGMSATICVPEEWPELPGLAERLEAMGDRVLHSGPHDRTRPWSAEEVRDLFSEADVIVASLHPRYPRDVLAAAPRLRLVTSTGIGFDRIDVAAATELGILVANCPAPENVVGVAEATILLAVALLHQLQARLRALRSGAWQSPVEGRILWRRAVGLVGYGHIARAVADRLRGWEVQVRFHDPEVSGSTPLDELLRWADVLSVHVPLTRETRHLIGEPELGLLKRSAILVNTSRGGVVDEAALAAAIDRGRLAGAALDVFEHEPIEPDNPLLRCDPDRVLLTPHAIGQNVETRPSALAITMDNIERALRGEPPAYVVNPAATPTWHTRLARIAVGSI